MSKSKKEFLKNADKIQKDILSLSQKATQKEIQSLKKNEKHSITHSISHSSHKSSQQFEGDEEDFKPVVPWTIEQEEYDDMLSEWKEFYIDYNAYRKLYSDIPLAIGLLRKDLHKISLFFHYEIRTIAIKWASTKLSDHSMNPVNIDIIKHEIECLRAFHHFHQSLFTKISTYLFSFLTFVSLSPYSDEVMERSWKAIQTLEVVFQNTSSSVFIGGKIASIEEEELWKLNEKDAFMQEREKYVLSTSLLRKENKKYASISCCFLLIIPIVVNSNLEDGGMSLNDIPFYRAFFVLSFYLSCLSACLWIWSAYKINYRLILETPYQKTKPVFWTSVGNVIAVLGCVYALYDPTFLNKSTTKYMMVITALTLVVLGYSFILRKLAKMIRDLSHGIAEFRSTFLIDQINSLSLAFSDFEYSICYHVLLQSEHYCMDSKRLIRGFLLAGCPYFLRLTATMIQIFTKHSKLPIYKRPALVNASKYMLVILAMWLKYQKHFNPSLKLPWLAVQIAASLFNLHWDTVHDWGLPKRIHNQNKQIFKKQWVYNLGFMANTFLRFFWFISENAALKSFFLLDRLDGYELAGLSSMCEVLRRNIWNVFTLENHQIKINEENFVVFNMESVKLVSEEKILVSDNAEAKKILVEIASITKKITRIQVKDYAKLIFNHLQAALLKKERKNAGADEDDKGQVEATRERDDSVKSNASIKERNQKTENDLKKKEKKLQ